MKILALDLATKTGWAYRSGSITESGVEDFSLKRGDSPGMRYHYFNGWLTRMLDSAKWDVVMYEQTHQRGGAATEVCAGLSTRVLEACAVRKIDVTTVHSQSLKKFATGKGNAKKPVMIAAAQAKWQDIRIIDDNHADALWILAYAESVLTAELKGASQ